MNFFSLNLNRRIVFPFCLKRASVTWGDSTYRLSPFFSCSYYPVFRFLNWFPLFFFRMILVFHKNPINRYYAFFLFGSENIRCFAFVSACFLLDPRPFHFHWRMKCLLEWKIKKKKPCLFLLCVMKMKVYYYCETVLYLNYKKYFSLFT